MKKYTPIIIYVTVLTISLLLAKYRVTGYSAIILLLNVIFFFIYFMISIIHAFKYKFKPLKIYVLMWMSLTFLIVWLKLDFTYYHFYYHLVYFILFISLSVFLYESDKVYLKKSHIILFTILLNICILSIDDYTVFKFWNSNKIAWSQQKLTWDHYKQAVPEDSGNSNAFTSAGLQWKKSKVNNTPSILIIGYMIPSESWVKENKKSDYLLKHEQLYFDICELYARKIRKIFKESQPRIDENGSFISLITKTDSSSYYKLYNGSEAENRIQYNLDESNKTISSYATSTLRGKYRTKQLEWEAEIEKEIEKLSDYKR